MSYMALYRKFRPDRFEEVKGQDHIVTTLKNQMLTDRLGHAYLFCGTRGTGKTTVAKILAKAVNCEHPVNGSPCGQCASCKSIASGASMNVIEIDAASNNGVDNIRQIREEVQYPPTEGRYKVYIIDEVHMLSIGAFNALLKTLEEPPSYVIFILATTEAHKLPITILSRCQRYDFRRISTDTIEARLHDLMVQEGQEAEEKALRYVAKCGDGSMRDALSLLDRCLAFYMGEPLTYEHVLEVLGSVDTSVFEELFRQIVRGNTAACVRQIDELVTGGRELGQFVIDFIWYLRNLLLAKTSEHPEEILDLSEEQLSAMKEDCTLVSAGELIRYIRIFSDLSNQMKFAGQKRVLLEIAVIKLTKPEMEETVDSLTARLERLEEKIASGAFSFAMPQMTDMPVMEKTPETEAVTNGPAVRRAVPEEVQYVVDHWNLVQNKLPSVIRYSVASCRFAVEGENTLVLLFTTEQATNYETVTRFGAENEISGVIAAEMGYEIRVIFRLLEESGQTAGGLAEVIRSRIHMEIEEE